MKLSKEASSAKVVRRWKSESWQPCLSLQATAKASPPEAETQNAKQASLNLFEHTEVCFLPKN